MIDLEAIELIKQLKARYFRFLDTADVAGLQSVFTGDAHAYFKGGEYEFDLNGWHELEAFYKTVITSTKFGMHHGHHPEISVDGDSAAGIWYLQDIFYNLDENVVTRGTALYEDEYRKEGGEWKIARTGYKRLYEEMQPMARDVTVTVRPIAE